MPTAVRLGGYLATLALVVAIAWGSVALLGRDGPGPPGPAASDAVVGAHEHGGHQHVHDGADAAPAGLAATAAGYSLVPQVTSLPLGVTTEYAFTITGSDGRPVTTFDVQHEQPLHMVVVRRDTTGFQHLHPRLGRDGVWRTPLALPAAGVYRMYADLVPTGGPALTLGTDLFVAGDFVPEPAGASRVARVDGYEVRLDGELTPGGTARLVATVTRDGRPVSGLEPYLGAYGHLVALRQSDLAYLHVHPADGAGPGPAVAFDADIASAGTYRLFLDFRHGGVVRTADFTIATTDPHS
jgi:hypothetical protein